MRVLPFLLGLPLLASCSVQVPLTPPSPPAPRPPSSSSSAYTPTSISQTIELTGSLVRSTTVYSLERTGDGNTWLVGLRDGPGGGEGFVAVLRTADGARKPVSGVEKLDRQADARFFSIPVDGSPATTTLTIQTVNALAPLSRPTRPTLPQTADTLSYTLAFDLVSAIPVDARGHAVEELKVRVKAPTPRIEAVVTPDGADSQWTKGGATVTWTLKPQGLRSSTPQIAGFKYVQPEPLGTVRSYERHVEVSHWGSNVHFRDDVDVYNSGPKLEGQFSRIEHQKNLMTRRLAALGITALSFLLPPRVHHPYYYDTVGNVSTSHFRPSSSSNTPLNAGKSRLPSSASRRKAAGHSLLEVTPRYPLMGGWNYSFTVGYDAPLEDYLAVGGGGRRVLKVPFVTALKDWAVERVAFEVLLPEAARNIKVHVPFAVESLAFPTEPPAWSFAARRNEGYHYRRTYLDSTGRPAVSIVAKGCTDRHDSDIIIEYEVNAVWDVAQKPLAVAAVLASLFALTMGVKRLQWGIP